ncbi:unnamed protein product [Enterobius vermicularis]|uniref:Uncharacterized protein n=1 Tax=Enterobius vermicularis TaxID=51028 RepID=A0A0N4VNB7_ENTVE|nr:unnamed protein product [Enterobius vermicularis]
MEWFVPLIFVCILFQTSDCSRLKKNAASQNYIVETRRARLRRELLEALDELGSLDEGELSGDLRLWQGKPFVKRRNKFEFIRFGR